MKELRNIIEDVEWYKGGSKLKYSISASKAGGELLPLWLSKKFDKDKSSRIGLNYQGSAFHYGMEKMVEDIVPAPISKRYKVEVPGAITLSNGWLLTGTADVCDIDMENVHDYKTTSASGYKFMQKAAKDIISPLAIQGATLLYLNGYRGKFFAEVFVRDHKPWRKDHPASAYQQLPVDTMSEKDLLKYLVAKTDKLQDFIDKDIAPPECEDLMWIIYEGDKIKLKCEYYCDYKSNCPRYKSSTNPLTSAKLNIGGW